MHYLRKHRHDSTGPIDAYREYHDLSDTKEYQAWQNMLQRCQNTKHPSYPRYGGRGISVCELWTESFSAFLTDIGPAPSARHSLDRTDNDGGYEPGNCRWVLPIVNGRNRPSTKLSELKADQIRNLAYIGIATSVIARQFGIDPSFTKKIINGKRWAPRRREVTV
jgi:hypothetical protein